MMYEHYLGVDLHKRRSYVVLMDADGHVQEQKRLSNDEMSAYISQLPDKTFAVLETTSNWSFIYDMLEAQVERVVLAHPKQVRAIATARVKNDRLDATMLAHLARTNLLPTSYAAPQDIRALRETVRHRAKLVRERTRHKNRIHRVLTIYNIQPPCSDLFGKRGRTFLDETIDQLSSTHQTIMVDYLLMIDTLTERIKQLDKDLRQWSTTDPRAALLLSMPGIGIYSAAIIVAEIGDIARFPGAKQLCSFAGLTPATRSSDMRVHQGRITREGSSWLRWIMVSAAHSGPRRSPRLQAFLDRVSQKHGRKTARVALARKMLSIIYFMLQRNTPYLEAYQPN